MIGCSVVAVYAVWSALYIAGHIAGVDVVHSPLSVANVLWPDSPLQGTVGVPHPSGTEAGGAQEGIADDGGGRGGDAGAAYPELLAAAAEALGGAGGGAQPPARAGGAGTEGSAGKGERVVDDAGKRVKKDAKKKGKDKKKVKPPQPPKAFAVEDGVGAIVPDDPADDGAKKLLVALAASVDQWQGTLVVINSAVQNAAKRERLVFRLVAPSVAQGDELIAKLVPHLPDGIDLKAVDFSPFAPRVTKLLGGNTSLRTELFSALNFAAFYLHELFPDVDRVLYLDTDVVVRGDLAPKLAMRDMHDKPAAVAQDCAQPMRKYINFTRVKAKKVASKLPLDLRAKAADCVINRGVVLVNTKRWAADKITLAIEALVQAHLSPKIGPLWRSGVSQPPFLLVLAKRYDDLGVAFNIRGLGRGDMSREERKYYEDDKVWQPYFNDFIDYCHFDCCDGCKDWAWSPHISPLAHQAMILHFNGRLKPSKAGRRSTKPLKPPAKPLSDDERKRREKVPLCSCGKGCLQECAGWWWKYLPESAG